MATIKDIVIREIFDSRGNSTHEAEIIDQQGNSFRAQIPAGKSRGKNEVVVFNYSKAQGVVTDLLREKLIGKTFGSITEMDEFLISLDGTPNKEKIGGNVILGISVAYSRMLCFERKKELWMFIREEFFKTSLEKKPLIFSNLINGGAHASTNLDIQEYIVVAKTEDSMTEGIKRLICFYQELGEFLKKKSGDRNLPIGDEGGYAVDFKNNFEPIKILEKLIFEHGLDSKFSLGLDVAASHFYQKREYVFERRNLSTRELESIYLDYFKKSKLLFSIEDPFAEDDFDGFKKLNEELSGKWVVGDDLTTTNPEFIKNFSEQGLINSVIIKPNQIGTVTETCEALNVAKKNNLKCIISHRSGETEDNFIIHLAKASGADGVKIGAPVRERIFKFNELIRIYK